MQIRLATRLVRSNRFSDCTLADAAGIAKVHVDTWRATYAGLVPDAHLANLHYERSTEFWQRNFTERAETNVAYVAEDPQGRIVGFASAGPEREKDPVFDGEIYAIYILKAHQGQGIGRKLTQFKMIDSAIAYRQGEKAGVMPT